MTIEELAKQMERNFQNKGGGGRDNKNRDQQGNWKSNPHSDKSSPTGLTRKPSDEQPNVGWLYYFDYFKDVEWKKVGDKEEKKKSKEKTFNQLLHEHKNERLYNLNLGNYRPNQYALPHLKKDEDTFDLTTTYPGLLVGSGYPHEIKSQGEVKLGFFFDHTSGLPIIPGSSVKGVCRSVFMAENKVDLVNFFIMYESEDGSMKPIREKELSEDEVEFLKEEIFDGIDITKKREKEEGKNHHLPASRKDIFHDAIIWSSAHPYEQGGTSTGRFLANDFITPHINRKNPQLSPFTDPQPLQFLKVLPKVKFRFQFDLKDNGTVLNKKEKMELFKRILLHLGIGAKTNTGYGQFEPE